MIDINELRTLAVNIDNFKVTKHVAVRFKERGIKIGFVRNALLNGEIIEQYPDDYPFPSCLVLGLLNDEKPIHVCIGLGNNQLWIITAYYPDTNEWEDDFKTRKAVH